MTVTRVTLVNVQSLDESPELYDEVVDALIEADRLYYDDPDNATLPDVLYDQLYRLVQAHEEKTGNVREDSPTQRVQGSSTFAPTKHWVPMLSLDKAYTPEELAKFAEQFESYSMLSVEPKLDGASLSLEYSDGHLRAAITRGDGVTGDDVTKNAALIRGVPCVLPKPYENFSGWVRGEVVILKDDFAEINRDGQFANARNAAAGALRHKDPHQARARRLTFVAYDSSDDHIFGHDIFTTSQWVKVGVTHLTDIIENIGKWREGWPFESDGIVVKTLDTSLRSKLGSTGKHPRWAIAYKTQGDTYVTRLNEITWQVGVNGMVTPVAELAEVQTSKGKVARATLHNPKFISQKDIRIGDEVEITYAGDVIPYVIGTVRHAGDNPVTVETPNSCPACATSLVQEGNSGQVKCPNRNYCKPQIVGRMVKWASRDAADIDAIGPTWMEKFVTELPDFNSLSDLYAVQYDELIELDGMGDVLATKIIDNIKASKRLGMRRALVGFSIPHVSEGTAKRLTQRFEGVGLVFAADDATLLGIEDIGPTVVASLREWYENGGKHDIKELRMLGVNLDRLPEDAPKVGSLTGKTFVITGSIPGYKDRKMFGRVLEGAGAKIGSSVSKSTDYLITDDPDATSGKAKKARELGVAIISPAEAQEMLDG